MIQLMLELTVVAFFVMVVFVSSVAVPVYTLTARGRWGWLLMFVTVTFAWVWGMHWYTHGSAQMPVQLTAAEVWWNQYWWYVAVLFYQVVGLALGIAVRRQTSVTWVLFAPVVASGILVGAAAAGVVLLAPRYLGQDAMVFMQAQLVQAVQQTLTLAKDIPADQQVLMQNLGGQTLRTSLSFLPATIWLLGLLVTSLTLFFGKWFVPRELWMKYQGGLTRWKSGGLCVWSVIILGALFLVNAYVAPLRLWMSVVANGLIGLAGLFLLQGALIATYYIRRQREGIFRWMWVVLIALFFQTAVMVMILLGVFDYWADFRRIDQKILL